MIFINIISNIVDFDENNKEDMEKILQGRISFHPGWNVDWDWEKRAIKAPSIRGEIVEYPMSPRIRNLIENGIPKPRTRREVKGLIPNLKTRVGNSSNNEEKG